MLKRMGNDTFFAWRMELKLSQEQMAEKLDVSRVTISRWENGRVKIPKRIQKEKPPKEPEPKRMLRGRKGRIITFTPNNGSLPFQLIDVGHGKREPLTRRDAELQEAWIKSKGPPAG